MTHDPWSALEPGIAKRVDSAGKYDFFWIYDEAKAPALLFRLESGQKEIKPLPRLKDVDLQYRDFNGRRALVLSLRERPQLDLFEILSRDIVAAGEAAANSDLALKRAVQRTRRWHHLLRGGSLRTLSIEEQRGLVGELSVLRNLVDAIGPAAAIDAWTGPAGTAKDFELGSVCIEVKAKRNAAKPFAHISSEDQLADVPGARLFLHVADVASAIKPQGQTLHDHVAQTEKLFEPATPAFDLWEAAIASTGYETTQEYEDRRWELVGHKDYEIVEGFPRIELPLVTGVSAVKYSIALDACTPFEVQGELMAIVKLEYSNE